MKIRKKYRATTEFIENLAYILYSFHNVIIIHSFGRIRKKNVGRTTASAVGPKRKPMLRGNPKIICFYKFNKYFKLNFESEHHLPTPLYAHLTPPQFSRSFLSIFINTRNFVRGNIDKISTYNIFFFFFLARFVLDKLDSFEFVCGFKTSKSNNERLQALRNEMKKKITSLSHILRSTTYIYIIYIILYIHLILCIYICTSYTYVYFWTDLIYSNPDKIAANRSRKCVIRYWFYI